MPIFDFCCNNCGKQFEGIIFPNDTSIRCPNCNSSDIKKLLVKPVDRKRGMRTEKDLEKIVKQTLERVRRKLLDLSRRNTLLNFKETRRTIRIVDELPDETFRLLVTEGKTMELLPFEPPQELENNISEDKDNSFAKNQTTRMQRSLFDMNVGGDEDNPSKGANDSTAKNQKTTIDTNYELPELMEISVHKHIDTRLQTPFIDQVLERRCKTILHNSRTGIEETGINFLYLAIGFLEWYENDSSDEINRAPLLLVPIRIERTRLNAKTNCYTYVVSYSGEDIETNLSLAKKLDQDFNLILPDVTEDITPEDYFNDVKDTIKKKQHWRVAREMVIGFFSFSKLRLYKDLDGDSWPNKRHLMNHKIIQHIVAGRDRDETGASLIYGEEYAIDEHPDADKIPLVLDTDSSQHSAIIDIISNGKSLVIEGPPGTGKSQTITNVIAAALYEGKNVLFVAEKKAALEVVRNRFDAIGLGDFCLELHSHKTQKGQLHADLRRRINQDYQDAEILDQEINDFQMERDRLKSYYGLLNSSPGATNETIYEIFWAAERWRGEIEGEPVLFPIDNALELTRSQINSFIAVLEDFVRLNSELPDDVSITWGGFEPELLLPGDEKNIHDQLSAIKKETKRFVDRLETLLPRFNKKVDNTIPALRRLTHLNLAIFAEKPERWEQKLALKFLNSEVVNTLNDLDAAIEKQRSLSSKANKILGDYDDWSLEDLRFLAQGSNQMESFGYADLTPDRLQNLREVASSTSNLLDEFRKSAESINYLLSETPERLSDFARISEVRKLLEEASPDIAIHAHPEYALKIASTLQDKAHQEHRLLSESLAEQSDYFLIDQLPDSLEVDRLRREVRKYDSWVKRLFSSEYRHVKQDLRSFLTDQKFIKKPDFVNRLDKLKDILDQIHVYEENEDYQKVFGPLFKGMKTDWHRLNQVIEWSQKLTGTIGSENRAKVLLSSFLENKEKIELVGKKMDLLWDSVKENLDQLKLIVKVNEKLSSVCEKIQEREIALKDFLQGLPRYQQLCHADIKTLRSSAQAGLELENLREKIEGDRHFPKHLGKEYQGFNTDTKKLKLMVEWIVRLKKEKGIKQELTRWLLSRDTGSRISLLTSLVNDTRDYFEKFDGFIEKLSKAGSLAFDEWMGVSDKAVTLSDFLDKLEACIETSSYLVAWSDYCRAERKVIESGLLPIVEEVENGSISENEAVTHFRHALYRSMARELMQKHPELADFRSATYDNIRKRIGELDQSIQQLSRQRIAYRISQRSIPSGVSSGYIRDYTEWSLINHELSKKKRHIPIRQLVRRSGNALQALKPCFMMSPQSVAQYLVPGDISFDLVVMDEASQLRLEDALGVVARSDQVVVCGDPKQLPPTVFFDRLIESDLDEEEITAAEEAESILDICQNCFDVRRLRWHYRSEHEHLIAFSNSEFYDNDLIVFPSPYNKGEDYGVHHHYVEGAFYQKGRNRIEANSVATAIMDHFKRHPELSLGVATFNIEQRDLIQDELERIQKENIWLEKRIKDTEKTEEPFFIKNLENVQGDERDVIFISTTYGPDRDSGKVYQRFGPINLKDGWRRLNVIVTRAKKRLDLYTSMRSSDVKIPPGVSRGAMALRRYLEYAEKEIIPDFGDKSSREPGSNFEIAVAKLLNQHGYQTAYQVGVAGFFIDIGVKHPNQEEGFILGIECDGASYHSAKSIRDRDILRQQILKSKGWRIYRIWSTDWFKNKDKELNKLLKTLDELVEAEWVKVKYEEPKEEAVHISVPPTIPTATSVNEELRNVLLEYRRKKVEPKCQDISRSILSDQMLEEFVQRKPITREEFYNFPLALREKIESGQGQFIDEILEIVEEITNEWG